MSPENDAALCASYPRLYRDRHSPESCMIYGFACGNGWYSIIDKMSAALEQLTVAQGEEHACAVQVKEKFGTLRVYLRGATAEMYAILDLAVAESAHTCERCGSPGWLRMDDYRQVLCDGCYVPRNDDDEC